jgi:cytochrome c peroxidase
LRKAGLIIGFCIVIAGYAFQPGPPAKEAREKAIARTLVIQIDSFTNLVNGRFETAVRTNGSERQLQQLFLETRMAYKRFEWAAEYFNPTAAMLLNGPPVPEAEPASEGGPGRFRVLQPEGLQVIEALLFPRYDAARKEELLARLRQLQTDCDKYKVYFNNIAILDWQVFDAAKLEVFRLMTLGIAGFDAPLSKNCMNESAASLESLRAVLFHYGDGLIPAFRAAVNYLRQDTAFDTFDRAIFITAYGNPLTRRLTRLEQDLNIPVIRYNRLLRQDAATLFDKDAFNADAYAPGPEYFTTAQKIALGKKLFFDPLLSGTRTRSCASCHQPDKAFADGLVRNTIMGSDSLLPRNTPTLLNAALQPAQFYDLRASTLEDQVRDVLENHMEMQGSVGMAAERLWRDTLYRRLFSEVFPAQSGDGILPGGSGILPGGDGILPGGDGILPGGSGILPGRNGIDTLEVMNALGAYVRSLVFLNSRFDDYMRGDSTALNPQEVRGFNLFMGKARCGTCHYMPLFNGTFPPRYTRMETEVIGVPGSMDTKVIDEDMGRFGIAPEAFLRHAFKTTTVRNAARTAPYMHNGVFATLQQVMDFYNNGGGAGMGSAVDNQTLATDSLHLTGGEENALIAFIKSLDSR